MEGLIPEAYAPFAQRIFASFAQPAAVTTESDVAEAVWRAANDASGQLRFPAGADAVALAQCRTRTNDRPAAGRPPRRTAPCSTSGYCRMASDGLAELHYESIHFRSSVGYIVAGEQGTMWHSC